ncbi:MAG: FAD-dependent oxidoreductase [Firmicutes bacterium]|nr:FAD-dependent oxidoreductase [Alicyclobacillaceae bacterium]MCL6496515.1 FAD-dependent oxidoreductase [Bacillota bacterium]
MLDIETREYDVVVVGAGGAGLRAAIEASGRGSRVAVLTKSLLGKAHTVMAEGGIAASFGNLDPYDGWETHFYDTMKSGHFINNYRMVELYTKEAPERVLELESWGAVFDRTEDGKIMQRPFGAHSFRRLAHVGDRTGKELIRTLQQKVVTQNVDIFAEVTTTRIFLDRQGRVAGLFAYHRDDGHFVLFKTRAIILATGGWGRMYKPTSNSWECTGDGAAMAFRVGAELQDMEMVQFHPTGMVWPPGVRGILVTEGVRGEGGLLYNAEGERFMLRYDPEKKELSSRDVVARSIYREVKAGRGTPHGGAWLDITHKGPEYIKRKLPGMYEQFKKLADVDITKERFEVAPTVHYTMGGLRVHPELAATNVPGLYAAGETACGLHGANRLGGNSLGDLLVFGRRAGMAAHEYVQNLASLPEVDEAEVRDEMRRVLRPFEVEGGENPYLIHEALQTIMSTYAGIERSGPELEKGLAELEELKARAERMSVDGPLHFNPGWHTVFEVQSMLLLAEAIFRGALERKESRGAHWRTDYPEELPEYGRVNFVQTYEDGRYHIRPEPVPEMPPELARLFEAGVAPGVLRARQAQNGREETK